MSTVTWYDVNTWSVHTQKWHSLEDDFNGVRQRLFDLGLDEEATLIEQLRPIAKTTTTMIYQWDIESEMTRAMAAEITKEIDSQIIKELFDDASR